MKTFIFSHKGMNIDIVVSAEDFNDADTKVDMVVKNSSEWVVEDEDGTQEEEFKTFNEAPYYGKDE